MDGLHCCASHWALFQSRGWLPIVEATGYSRHPTSILAMQLFNGINDLTMERLATVKRIILTYLPAPPHSIGIPVLG